MRITLSTSPHVRHPAVLQADFEPTPDVMYTFAPVGLLSLIGQLRTARPNDRARLYDLNRRVLSGELPLNGSIYRAIADELVADAPDVIGFMTECDSYHHVLQICEAAKAASPRCTIVLGGPHASAVAAATMRRCAYVDAVVLGEGELSFASLLDAVEQGLSGSVPGVVRRTRAGDVLEGGLRPLIDDLDELPLPAYDAYSPYEGEEIFVEVGRGCPFQCSFCSTAPYWNRKHRTKSPARIVAELELVNRCFGARRVHFTHDLFTTNRAWVTALCDRLRSEKQSCSWTCSARTDTVDDGLLAAMASAGCSAIYFGIESGSPRILERIHKAIPLERSFAVVRACKNAGITPNVGFIVGFPGEDADSFCATLTAHERAVRLGCKPAHLFSYNPFAGSALYSELTDLVCDGHFIDLPLGRETDEANRAMIRDDQDLYGSYFRPRTGPLVPGRPDALRAADEFSPLVEATLMPCLALAGYLGGMYELFARWVAWITEENRARGAAAYRAAYGSPRQFSRFLSEMLGSVPHASSGVLAAARALEIGFRVGERFASRPPTTMANHRSFAIHAPERRDIALTALLSCNTVLEVHASEFDVRPVFRGTAGEDLRQLPTYLVWQLGEGDSIRLLDVDRQAFEMIQTLRAGALTAGDLLIRELDAETSTPPDAIMETLSSLMAEGLVAVEG